MKVTIEFECTENELKTLCGSDLEETIIAMIGEKIIEEKMKQSKPIKRQAPKKAATKKQAPKKKAAEKPSKLTSKLSSLY